MSTPTHEEAQQISPDELAFQQTLMQEQERLAAALDYWGRHMMQKYKLTPKDGIAPDGKIIRNAAAHENEQVPS